MSEDPAPPVPTVATVLQHCLGRPPTLGAGRLICLDGPAGSGKTTLADALVEAARRRVATLALLHMDDLYEGWSGLGEVATRLTRELLGPLSAGAAGHYRRWDWAASGWAEEHVVDPVDLVVLEGVGSGAREYAALVTTLVWVEADESMRLERGVARDGEELRPQWVRWLADEAAHFAANGTRTRADLRVDGHGRLFPGVAGGSTPPAP